MYFDIVFIVFVKVLNINLIVNKWLCKNYCKRQDVFVDYIKNIC